MPAHDYSAVSWPWDDDPNWDAPREGATSDPADEENWRLACGSCRLYFPPVINPEIVEGHMITLHGRDPRAEEPLELYLTWVGLGVPPVPPERLQR